MLKKTTEERFTAAMESIAKSLAVMADARKSDKKAMDEIMKIAMPMMKRVASESAKSRSRRR